jgi:hypothetical protein
VPSLPEIVALHNLVVGESTTFQVIGATDPSVMHPRAQERLSEYHDNVVDRQEFNGDAVRAWWDGRGAPPVMDQLLRCPVGDFPARTEDAMRRLVEGTRGNAKPGLVAFTRFRDNGTPRLACFKLELAKLEEVQWQAGQPAASALVPIDVADLLPHAKQLQKAAVYPGPGTAEVWVVDDQLTSPADYWMRFLGARANPGEKQRLQQVITATRRTLVELEVADPEPAIARAVALVREREEAVLPADFAQHAAQAAGVSAQTVIERTTSRDPVVMDRGFSVTPLAARQTRTTYDLGDGIKLTGPRGVIEDRVEHVPEDGRQYLKILITDGPHISHS